MRAQELANKNGIKLHEGPYYLRNVFVWLPKIEAKTNYSRMFAQLQTSAIRSYYYTSVVGDEDKIFSIRINLWKLGFQPKVFKKSKQQAKSKGVDIALATDLLSHAYLDNYDFAVLVAGDGDYLPLVEEVKRLGKGLGISFFTQENGLSNDLLLASDTSDNLEDRFIASWRQ